MFLRAERNRAGLRKKPLVSKNDKGRLNLLYKTLFSDSVLSESKKDSFIRSNLAVAFSKEN